MTFSSLAGRRLVSKFEGLSYTVNIRKVWCVPGIVLQSDINASTLRTTQEYQSYIQAGYSMTIQILSYFHEFCTLETISCTLPIAVPPP